MEPDTHDLDDEGADPEMIRHISAFSTDGVDLMIEVSLAENARGTVLLDLPCHHGEGLSGAAYRLSDQLVAQGFAVARLIFHSPTFPFDSSADESRREREGLRIAYQWMTAHLPAPYGVLTADRSGAAALLELEQLSPVPAALAMWNPILETAAFHRNLGACHLGRVRTLIVHGTGDRIVPVASSIAAASAPRVELIVLPGAGHGFPEPWSAAESERVTAAWFVDQLGSASLDAVPDEEPSATGNFWHEYQPFYAMGAQTS